MKIACNTRESLRLSVSAFGFLCAMVGCAASPVFAAEVVAPEAPPSPALAVSDPVPAAGAAVSPPPSLASSSASTGNRSANLAALEDKVSDSVKSVVKQFGSIDNVNLDDLNTARQALAKLDVLIDIEKRLGELNKVRSERGSERSVAAAIPQSALMPPSPPPAATSIKVPLETPVAMPFVSRAEVSRITGADGHYAAVVQGRTVRVGDSLPDGSTVLSISARALDAKAKDGAVRHLKVKGVEAVYGGTL